MTPARLQSFLAIVDAGSARAAAAQLHVTESAVSASLAALQQEVGTTLFARQGRGLRLTESGAVFAAYARQILGLIDESVVATRSSSGWPTTTSTSSSAAARCPGAAWCRRRRARTP
jgi:LysR family transcriptional regulator, low CO2-responsive transcriptional regulator